MLDIFTTNKYDSNIAVIHNAKEYTLYDLKNKIAAAVSYIQNKKKNVVILTKNNFEFIILFFASIFSNKNIYLVTDKTRLNTLNIDFDILEYEDYSPQNYDFPKINPKDIVINFYTSGSTDEPKIIKKSLFNLIREAEDIGKEFNLKHLDLTIISTTTMCHLFGMTFHLMFPLVNGLKIYTNSISYAENVNIENAILVSTPTFLLTNYKYKNNFQIDPKYIISAGSKLDEKVFEYFENHSKVIDIYGSTETGVIGYKTHYNAHFRLFSNVEMITNESYTEIQSDYAYDSKAIVNDKIELYDRSFLIKNRTDKLFKIQEKRVSGLELEKKLKENNFVNDCCILKIDEKLVCLTALSDSGQKFLLKEGILKLTKRLKMYLLDNFEIIPQRWRYIDEMPMNKMGKIDKKFVEKIFNINLSLPIILCKKIENNVIILKLYFYKNCNFFKGHFPNFPIVPGVVQIYLAQFFANNFYGLSLGMGQWKKIKFSRIIKSESIVELKLEKNDKQVNYEYFVGDKRFSSGVFPCDNIFGELKS